MASNSITLIGNLTRDPELRFTTGGRGVASFGLAVNRRYQVNGEWQEQVSFFNIVCWGDLGENAAATLSKGSRCIVAGRLEQRSWETNDGEKRSAGRKEQKRMIKRPRQVAHLTTRNSSSRLFPAFPGLSLSLSRLLDRRGGRGTV